jgi:anti-sigma-K factor RskA
VAAAVLALAVVGGVVATRSNPTSAPLAAVASLEHLDAPASAVGHVSVHATSAELVMIVTTTGLPVLQANHFYEVWLLAPTTNKMLPLGVLSVTGRSTFTISRPLMSQFSAIDISLQDNDGRPQHSKTSVLRGTVTAV